MSWKNYHPEDLVDTYGLGFRFPGPGLQGPVGRNHIIAAVCWDGDEAQFVNPAGLVLPCKAGDRLRHQLTKASRREFGAIIGDGQFAMKPHVLKALEGAGTLRKWVLYHFDLHDCWFYDDAAAWATYVQADIAVLTPAYFLGLAKLELHLQQRQRFVDGVEGFGVQLPALPAAAELEERRQLEIAERLAALQEQRRQALEHDRQLGAWLRGELPTPPLLQSVARAGIAA